MLCNTGQLEESVFAYPWHGSSVPGTFKGIHRVFQDLVGLDHIYAGFLSLSAAQAVSIWLGEDYHSPFFIGISPSGNIPKCWFPFGSLWPWLWCHQWELLRGLSCLWGLQSSFLRPLHSSHPAGSWFDVRPGSGGDFCPEAWSTENSWPKRLQK